MQSEHYKHNTPAEDTLQSYIDNGFAGWLFTEAKGLLDINSNPVNANGIIKKVPTEDFFNKRKQLLIRYFKAIVKNQKEKPDNNIKF